MKKYSVRLKSVQVIKAIKAIKIDLRRIHISKQI